MGGLLIAYYAFPLRWTPDSVVSVGASLLVTVGALALVATVMIRELGSVRRGVPGRSARVLAMLLILLVMSASLTFFLLDQVRPDELIGLETRTDALYFTLSTMTTVGYGDVHAAGQIARALVCVMIVFDIVVVASLVRAQTSSPTRPPSD
ncbi:potassium channel family protein [Nocardioides sp. NPDC057767]|uniref:potassium channel family protein n=1 Tax=unclassified Nocardioides TaxID=2615069 RepID=UPI00366B8009